MCEAATYDNIVAAHVDGIREEYRHGRRAHNIRACIIISNIYARLFCASQRRYSVSIRGRRRRCNGASWSSSHHSTAQHSRATVNAANKHRHTVMGWWLALRFITLRKTNIRRERMFVCLLEANRTSTEQTGGCRTINEWDYENIYLDSARRAE